MQFLIEMPSSLLRESYAMHGANKITVILYQCLLNVPGEHRFVVVTDLSLEECKAFNQQQSLLGTCYFIRYSGLAEYLRESKCRIDIAVSFDAKIETLLIFRSLHALRFPVVGLIHSLGFYSHFEMLLKSKPYLMPYDRLICPSENTKQTAMKVGVDEGNLRVCHYGLDETKYKPVEDKTKIRQSLDLPLDAPIVLVLSRLSVSVKMDLTPFIRSIPLFLKECPNAMFYIVGFILDHDYVKELKHLVHYLNIDKHVIWEHEPDNKGIEQYYQAADIFVSLSDQCGETYGLTVMEAMGCGIPVVISEFAGYKMHIEHAKQGFYISSMSTDIDLDELFYGSSFKEFGYHYSQSIALDINGLEKAVTMLLTDETLRKKMGHAARELIEKRNTLKAMQSGYMSVFEECIACAQKSSEDVRFLPYKDVASMLLHQVSRVLKGTDILRVSRQADDALKSGKDVFFFKGQLTMFKLIRVVLHILNEHTEMTLTDLCSYIKASDDEIRKNVMFLLKQGFLVVVEKD